MNQITTNRFAFIRSASPWELRLKFKFLIAEIGVIRAMEELAVAVGPSYTPEVGDNLLGYDSGTIKTLPADVFAAIEYLEKHIDMTVDYDFDLKLTAAKREWFHSRLTVKSLTGEAK